MNGEIAGSMASTLFLLTAYVQISLSACSDDRRCGPGDLSGIIFQNTSIAAPSVLGEPQMLWGQVNARIRNLRFENLTIGGKLVRDATFFKMNEFVEGLEFQQKKTKKYLRVE